MRVEGGTLRGRTLVAPPGPSTRPTDGRTREMLFNSLGERVVGARFLDLYAGSGSVGIEALSRGAEFCIFIEDDFRAVKPLKENLVTLKLKTLSQVWSANARSSVDKLVESHEKFDIVFADPPFTHPNEAGEIAKRIDASPGLFHNELDDFRGPIVVIQHSIRVELPSLDNLRLLRFKKAGESGLSFFVPKTTETAQAE
ncbi:16S rRNA (guanine(966)-N(2))-methyltransferase RsmD [bacterium]|nr:MAG: 16S rRNA (guanine(966)-N(2))-methyltransferase RsmD [bacterium]